MTDPSDVRVDDDVSLDELREAVEHMHGVPARFVEAVEVDERLWSMDDLFDAAMAAGGAS